MALRFPFRVKVTTSQTGVLTTFSVSEPGQAGYRTLTRAVTDNDLASGDTIFCFIVDTTVTNGPALFQFSSCTWNNTTKQLSVVTTYQPNGTGPTWGAGTRDVLVVDNPLLALRATDSNIFTVFQEFRSFIELNKSSASNFWLRLEQLSAYSSIAAMADVTNKKVLKLESYFTGGGAPAGEVGIDFLVGNLASPVTAMKIREAGGVEIGTSLKTIAGAKYDAFPAGTKLMFGTNPPSGWTRVNASEDRVTKIAKSGETVGTAGGSWTISGLSGSGDTDSHTLTISEIPSHTHQVFYSVVNVVLGTDAIAQAGAVSGLNVDSGSRGGNGAHSHGLSSLSIAADGSWRPRYEIWIAATKDA